MTISKYSPIIIIGMHRSGTSMITHILEKLGLFMGKKKDLNNEALFFHKINRWILHQSGGAWDNPECLNYLFSYYNNEVKKLILDYICYTLDTPHIASYLGWTKYLRYRSLKNLDFQWGWKDPKNTFTLPLWREIFPNAKVIHIYRHGVDVANSLKKREDKILKFNKHNNYSKKIFWLFRLKKGGFTWSLRCSSLEGGFSLWEEYIRTARTYIQKLNEKAIEIKYEEFLLEPVKIMERLAKFVGLQTSKEQIIKLSHHIKKNRLYAYLNNPKLQDFALKVSDQLRFYGY